MGGFRDGYREDGEGQSYRSESSSSEEEDTARKPPFPAELKLAKTRLAKARRSGDEVLEGTALLAMGELKLRSAKYARALQRAEAALEVFPQAAGKAESVRLIVRVHLAEHNILEAYKLLEQRLIAFQRTPRDPKAVAILRLARADVCLALGRKEQALREGNEALAEFKRLSDEAWEAVADLTVARVSLQLKTRHLKRASQLADKALKFFKNVGDYDEEAAALLLISQLHVALQEYEDAHLFAKVAADMSRARGALSREASAQQQIASVMLAQQADPEAAGSFAKQAVTKFRKNGDALGEIAAHQVVASAYQAEGLVNMALEALNEALTLARKLGHRQLISTLLDSIVKIYDPEGALDVLREEEEMARRSGDVKRELTALRRVAMQQVVLERGQEALQAAEEAAELARAARDVSCEASAMQLLGEVSKAMGQNEEALDGLLHARTLLREVGDVPGEAAVLEMVVQIHESEGRDTKAQPYLEECQKLYQEAGWNERAGRTLLDVAKVLIRNRGVIRAVEKAREAIALFGDKDGEGKAFSADGYLELAEIMSGNIRYRTEAPECIKTEIFKPLEVPDGCTVWDWKELLDQGFFGKPVAYAERLKCSKEHTGKALRDADFLPVSPERVDVRGPSSVLKMLDITLRSKLGPPAPKAAEVEEATDGWDEVCRALGAHSVAGAFDFWGPYDDERVLKLARRPEPDDHRPPSEGPSDREYLQVGDEVDGYNIQGRLGEGYTGVVYLAEHEDDAASKVALKWPLRSSEVAAWRQIQRRVGIVPGLPLLLGSGDHAGQPYAMTELLGSDLSRAMLPFKKHPLRRRWSAVKVIGRLVLRRLEALHKGGYLHCDVSPFNVLFGCHRGFPIQAGLTLYLIDYGLAQPFPGGPPLRPSDGTTEFNSLRTASGCPRVPEDDLESLGWILLWLVTGGLPWAEDELEEEHIEKVSVAKRQLLSDGWSSFPGVWAKLADTPQELRRFLGACRWEELMPTGPPDYSLLYSMLGGRAGLDTREAEEEDAREWRVRVVPLL